MHRGLHAELQNTAGGAEGGCSAAGGADGGGGGLRKPHTSVTAMFFGTPPQGSPKPPYQLLEGGERVHEATPTHAPSPDQDLASASYDAGHAPVSILNDPHAPMVRP